MSSSSNNIRDDLSFVASATRQNEHRSGDAAIYFMWAVITLIGFSLPDFAPTTVALYWMVAGICGGLISWWLGARADRKAGFNDKALGRRYGLHWTIAAIGFFLSALPMILGQVEVVHGTSGLLLVGGIVYALAGVHLERPLLWTGLLMLAAYVVMVVFWPPYMWTVTGAAIALSLVWAGLAAIKGERRPSTR